MTKPQKLPIKSAEPVPVPPPTPALPGIQDVAELLSKMQETVVQDAETGGAAPEGTLKPEALVKPDIQSVLKEELETLRQRHQLLQNDLQEKNKELQNIRDTLLVLSGAIQGMEHLKSKLAD